MAHRWGNIYCQNLLPEEDCGIILSRMPKGGTEKSLSPIEDGTVTTILKLAISAGLISYLEKYPSENFQDYKIDRLEYFYYPAGSELEQHVDSEYDNGNVRNIGCVLFLNTVEDEQGCPSGVLHFPDQNVQVWTKSGNAVFFPAGFTYPHYVEQTHQDRHSIVAYIHKTGDSGSNY